MGTPVVTVIGGGLAGSECAYQLARRGVSVVLREMKPDRRSPAHHSSALAELVCSNSFRSDAPDSAIGMLHGELRALGSLVLGQADRSRVPAGEALAVDRAQFSTGVTQALVRVQHLSLWHGEVERLPPGTVVVATGPLTAEALTQDLEGYVGTRLYFYDAIAPIVSADSVDMRFAFRASRWGRGEGADYLNLPLDEEGYHRFVQALRTAEKVTPHDFEEPRYFEGCLPIEVMAERGEEVLAHGPMKPVGLVDPRTGRQAHAVVQLRQEDAGGTAYNLVGFQTRLTWPEQRRIFRTLPGLAEAEFLRLGQIHRNTYVDAPRLLDRDFSLRSCPRLFFCRTDYRGGGLRGVGRLRLPGGAGGACASVRPPLPAAAGWHRAGGPVPARHRRGPPGRPSPHAHQRHLQSVSPLARARAKGRQARRLPGPRPDGDGGLAPRPGQ